MVIFHSYVSLPEGIWMFQQIEPLSSQRAAFSHALIAALKVITSSLSRSARSAYSAPSGDGLIGESLGCFWGYPLVNVYSLLLKPWP